MFTPSLYKEFCAYYHEGSCLGQRMSSHLDPSEYFPAFIYLLTSHLRKAGIETLPPTLEEFLELYSHLID